MDLNEILSLYARYNKHANAEMTRILGTLGEERLHEKTASYYQTLGGLLNHALQSTEGTLRSMADSGFLPELIRSSLGAAPGAGGGAFTTLSEFAARRTRADEALASVSAEATAEGLEKTFTFTGRDKLPKTLSYGGRLLALYTHEVHHRGGVASILDGWGIENDWSSLMRFLFL